MSGIYIHIPFCKQACFYCDFHFSTSLKKKDELISSLIYEIELRKNELNNEVIETIYFGGGTPSMLNQSEIDSKNVCVAGGSFLNCNSNEQILNSGLFENCFFIPPSDDTGIPLGCAWYAYQRLIDIETTDINGYII